MLDVERIRKDFPILSKRVNGKPLVYLDNAATTHKPQSVIQAFADFYTLYNSNIHRSSHGLGNEATEAYERTRQHIAQFIGAASADEIIFTRNATEAINLVAFSWGRANLKPGDEILVTEMEHHANIVPWQLVAEMTGAVVRFLPITQDGKLDLKQLDQYLGRKTKLFAFAWASNVLGTINPVEELIRAAKKVGSLVLIDAAQGIPHLPANVQKMGCDFFAFSGHKMLGPTGVGVLWGKAELLEAMPPYQGGGSMIDSVTLKGSTWNKAPWKFEAGTPDIAAVAAFEPALAYLDNINFGDFHAHERELTKKALEKLQKLKGFRLYGPENLDERVGLLSFSLEGINPQDVGQLLDSMGVAVRTGLLCTHPIMKHWDVGGMIRVSFYLYNTLEEVDILQGSLQRAQKMLVPAMESAV